MESLFGNVFRLLRRQWYVVVAVLVLGAVVARVIDSADVSSTEILHVAAVEDVAKTLGLKDVPGAPAPAVAAQAPGDFKRSPDFVGLTGVFAWDDIARSLTVTISGTDAAAVATGASHERALLVSKIEQPVGDSIKLAITDLDNQVQKLTEAAAAIDKSAQDLAASDPTRPSLLATASDLRAQSATALARRGSLASLETFVTSIVTSEQPTVTTNAPGMTTYLAGLIVAGVLLTLAACAWVLSDRRIRRRIHLEHAAPGVRTLGLVGPLRSSQVTIAPVLVASIDSFVRDGNLTSLVFFGVPKANASVAVLVAALEQLTDVAVTASDQNAAGTVRHDHAHAVGYVAVVRWGKTFEDELASAIADVRSVGGLAVATVLVDVPERDRSWVGAPSPELGSVIAEGV